MLDFFATSQLRCNMKKYNVTATFDCQWALIFFRLPPQGGQSWDSARKEVQTWLTKGVLPHHTVIGSVLYETDISLMQNSQVTNATTHFLQWQCMQVGSDLCWPWTVIYPNTTPHPTPNSYTPHPIRYQITLINGISPPLYFPSVSLKTPWRYPVPRNIKYSYLHHFNI